LSTSTNEDIDIFLLVKHWGFFVVAWTRRRKSVYMCVFAPTCTVPSKKDAEKHPGEEHDVFLLVQTMNGQGNV